MSGEFNQFQPEAGGLADCMLKLDHSRNILFAELSGYTGSSRPDDISTITQYATLFAHDFGSVLKVVLDGEMSIAEKNSVLTTLQIDEAIKRKDAINEIAGQEIVDPDGYASACALQDEFIEETDEDDIDIKDWFDTIICHFGESLGDDMNQLLGYVQGKSCREGTRPGPIAKSALEHSKEIAKIAAGVAGGILLANLIKRRA